jgi:hypothetical protein
VKGPLGIYFPHSAKPVAINAANDCHAEYWTPRFMNPCRFRSSAAAHAPWPLPLPASIAGSELQKASGDSHSIMYYSYSSIHEKAIWLRHGIIGIGLWLKNKRIKGEHSFFGKCQDTRHGQPQLDITYAHYRGKNSGVKATNRGKE